MVSRINIKVYISLDVADIVSALYVRHRAIISFTRFSYCQVRFFILEGGGKGGGGGMEFGQFISL